MGHSYLPCSGGIGFFTMVLARQAFKVKTFHTGDLIQKTIVVLGPVQTSLWKVKDTFHMAFL